MSYKNDQTLAHDNSGAKTSDPVGRRTGIVAGGEKRARGSNMVNLSASAKVAASTQGTPRFATKTQVELVLQAVSATRPASITTVEYIVSLLLSLSCDDSSHLLWPP